MVFINSENFGEIGQKMCILLPLFIKLLILEGLKLPAYRNAIPAHNAILKLLPMGEGGLGVPPSQSMRWRTPCRVLSLLYKKKTPTTNPLEHHDKKASITSNSLA